MSRLAFPFPYETGAQAEPGTEAQIQARFIELLRVMAPAVRVVSIPNEGRRSKFAAGKLKATGMAAGFPDLIVMAPGGRVAYVEMKARDGGLDETQKVWLHRLHQMGFPVGVFRNPDSAAEWLRGLGFPFVGRLAA